MRVIVTQPDGPVFHFTFCNVHITSNMAALDFNVIPAKGEKGDPGGVTDVQVNGASVVSSGIANIESDDLDFVASVVGGTPTITAVSGMRYICGEVSTLDIVVPASGIIDVTFVSGATPTVLTVTPPTGLTMTWANSFDPTALDANTTYEINIMDGMYGVVGKWA